MKTLKIFTKYGPLGASSRLRYMQYLPQLEQYADVKVYELLPNAYVISLYKKQRYSKIKILNHYIKRLIQIITLKKTDIVWLEKEFFPYFPAVFEKLVSLRGIKLITDYDDAIFHNYDLHRIPLIRHFLGRKIAHVMRLSSKVFVGNHYLGNYARIGGAKNVIYIPTVVSAKRYEVQKQQKHNMPVIGWIGSPATEKFLVSYMPVFQELRKKYPFTLRLIGTRSNFSEYDFVETRKWTEESEVNEINCIDIGIMPLPDEPFERGKCGFKLIQYMACGKAVVASDVGINAEIVENGKTGYIAKNNSEWITSLLALLNNENLRNEMGQQGRKRFESLYSLESVQVKVISEVLGKI